MGRRQQRQEPLKEGEKLEYPLKLSLEQLFTGLEKRIKVKYEMPSVMPFYIRLQINRKRRSPMGQYVNDTKVLTIDVRAGWKSGTKITFAKEGDEKPGYHAGDIIFVIQVSLKLKSLMDMITWYFGLSSMSFF